MPPYLHIQLLGEFRLLMDDRPVTSINQRRQQALLAYLLLHRHAPQPRQYTAYNFWPDSAEGQAQTNLRKLFFMLREGLPNADAFLFADSQSIGWRPDANFALDVAELELALDTLEQSDKPDADLIQRVVALYQGELFPACYEEWLLPMRRTLHERVVNTLSAAIAGLEAQHEYQPALRAAEHLLRLDPLHEATYRNLMQLRMLSGDRAGALRVYHECVTMLEQELEVSPTSETQAFYQHLLKSDVHAAAAPILAPVHPHQHLPLVGRKREWQLLQQAWQQMASRGPHVVMISGEAGIGKTRLVEELIRWARLRPGTVVYTRCYSTERALSYAPLTKWLHSDVMRRALAGLEALWLSELARLLPELLTEQPGLPPPTPMTEGWQRQRFHGALVRTVLATPTPRLLVLDDLQWCDTETIEWLHYLLRYDVHVPLLIVGTVRSEVVDAQHRLENLRQELQRQGQWTEFELTPLSIEETAVLADHLANEDVADWAPRLYAETEGNPLFVVEMVRAELLGSTDHEQMQRNKTLPPTIQNVISTRLNQLSPLARKLVDVAATIGRAFSIDVLAAASELDEDALVQGLDELWRRRVVREQSEGYDFSHDKIREVAYTQMSRLQRRILHLKVAQALERCLATKLHELADMLAYHYQQAESYEKAIAYYKNAAEVAEKFFATSEALNNVNKALSLVPCLTLERERIRHELLLQCMKGSILWTGRGPESGDCYQRAADLARNLDEPVLLEQALKGLSQYHQGNATHVAAYDLAHELVELALEREDANSLVVAYGRYGVSCFYLGNFGEARLALEKQISLCHEAANRDPGLLPAAYAWIGRVLWFLGYPEQAYQYSEEAIVFATTLPHQHSLFDAAPYCLRTYAYLRDWPRVQEMAELLLDLSITYSHPMRKGQSQIFLGYARAQQGDPQGGIQVIQDGVKAWQAAGARTHMPDNLSMLAEAYGLMGQWEEGLRLLRNALTLVERSDERWWEAELLRLIGVFTLSSSLNKEIEAESYYFQAIKVAQEQEAKSLELRAAISLSQLWKHQGKHEKACEMLSQMCSWFTEGFETCDLQEANALNDTLAQSSST